MRLSVLLLVLIGIATKAQAEDLQELKSLDVVVAGRISQQCALGQIPNIDFGNLERPGLSVRRDVAFRCNVPFTMDIVSSNGGLRHNIYPTGQGDYAGALPYAIAVSMPLRHPAVVMASKRFESRQLVGGQSLSSNGAIASDDFVLAVELGSPSGTAGLLGGTYSETITITVSPS